MLAPNHGKRRRHIVLRVVVSYGAVALGFPNVVRKQKRGRGWSTHVAGRGVVGSRPTQIRQIITREKRGSPVDEAAYRYIHIENSGGCKGVVYVESEQLAVVEFI